MAETKAEWCSPKAALSPVLAEAVLDRHGRIQDAVRGISADGVQTTD
jgi:hypothetical protein